MLFYENVKNFKEQEMKKAFSEVIVSHSNGKQSFSRKEIKKAFSRKSTKRTIEICNRVIKNPQTREQTAAFIKAVDGKQIKNTSGV